MFFVNLVNKNLSNHIITTKQKKKETGRSFEQELTGVVICFIAVFVAMGILIDDSMGKIGNAIVDFLFGMFGITNFLLPVLLFILGINLIMKNRENKFYKIF